MEFRILGLLEVAEGPRTVELRGFKVRTLLAVLLLRANEGVSTDALVEALWGDLAPDSAVNTLQGYISQLRKALGAGSIQTRAPGYVLNVPAEAIDAVRFERLLKDGQAALARDDPAVAARTLGEALGLWRGQALADFSFDSFAQLDIARLEELRLVAAEHLAEADLALGRHDELIGRLRALVESHPLRERLWGQLVLALYRSGRQGEALRALADVRRRLGEDLGIEPSSSLRRLEHAMLVQDSELEWNSANSASLAPRVAHHNLPVARSSFVGRQNDLAELDALLKSLGIVTIVGPGGVGKTRLAVEAARGSLTRYPDGAWLIELAALSEPSLVVKAAAAALGVQEEPGQPLIATLVRGVAERRSLIVLDNCEHLVESAARIVESLLAGSASLTILATSREPLRVEGEVVWRARPLPVPPDEIPKGDSALDSDAVRLFCERARAQGRFVLSIDNAAEVATLCRRLDGMPLAIELAAARSGALTPAQMLARLDDQFSLLAQGRRTALPRHQTLRGTIEWSYNLLSPSEQILFRELAVFAGSFSIKASRQVCGSGSLESLVDKSLVVARDDERYEILETLREYGAERLAGSGERETLHRRHADYYVDLAVQANALLRGPREQETLGLLAQEHDNVRAALSWLLGCGQADRGLRLATSLARFWLVQGHWTEGRDWLEKAIAANRDAVDRRLLAHALTAAGRLACSLADFGAAERLHTESLSVATQCDDGVGVAMALSGMGLLAYDMGQLEQARLWHEKSVDAWRAAGVTTGVWASLFEVLQSLGVLAYERGDLHNASRLFEESLCAGEDFGEAASIGPLIGLGAIAQAQGDRARAREVFERVLTIAQAFGYRRWVITSLGHLGRVAAEEGDAERATALYADALKAASALNDTRAMAWVVEDMVKLARTEGELERAAILSGAASGLRQAISAPIRASERESYEQCIAALRVALDNRRFRQLETQGRGLSPSAVVAFACGGELPPTH